MAASSPVTISHGMVNRRRTGLARRTAIDPANAAFIGSVLLLARYYRLIGWLARSGFFADCRRVECTPDAPACSRGRTEAAPALGCLIKPARRVFRLRRRCRSTRGQRRAGPGQSIGEFLTVLVALPPD